MSATSKTPGEKGFAGRSAIDAAHADLAQCAEALAQQWRLGADSQTLVQRLIEFREIAGRHFEEQLAVLRETGLDEGPPRRDYEEMIAEVDEVLADFARGSALHWFQMFEAIKRFLPGYPIDVEGGELPALAPQGGEAQAPLIAWSSDMEIGIDWIDGHHRAMADTMNEIGRLPPHYDVGDADALLERLRRSSWHHFHEEEARLPAGRAAREHVAHHRRLLAELDRLIFDVRARRADLTTVRDELCRWLVDHIRTADRRDFGK